MARRMKLAMLAAMCLGCVSIALSQETIDRQLDEQIAETFHVQDFSLQPPASAGQEEVPVPPPTDPFVDDEPTTDAMDATLGQAPGQVVEQTYDETLPLPMVYPTSNVGMFGAPPAAYPGTELWEGRCGGCETVGPCCRPPAWLSVDALWLQRNGPDDYLLATDGGIVELRNDDFDFGYETGVRISYGEVICGMPLEITYFGTHDWDSTIAVDGGPFNVPAWQPGAPTAFTGATRVEATYGSELHSIELNWLRFKGCHTTWIAGVRYIDAEEDFRLVAENANDGLIAITTDNRLIGGQIGADWNYGCGCWNVGIGTRAGLFANLAERDYLVSDTPMAANPLVTAEANDTELSFVGQLQIGVTRELFYGLQLRAGYEVMWINNLALAAEQLGTANPPPALPNFNVHGSTLYDGGYVGLQWHR